MAKDPAFLFYYQDFLVGTDEMTNEETGAYIKCLCHQAHRGHITKEHMSNICKTSDIQNVIIGKFKTDGNGCFFNQRLKDVVEKRKLFTESRRQNRAKSTNISHVNNTSKTSVSHMENENENETKDENTNAIDKDNVLGLFRELNVVLHPTRPCVRSKQYLAKLRARLQTYSAEEIIEAGKNLMNNAFMNGDNDGHRKYATMEYLTRNDEHVHKWLESGQGKISRLKENLDVTT